MRWGKRRRTLVDLLERALAADPHDAPLVLLEADIFADDLARYAPAAAEPNLSAGGDHFHGSATLPA